MTTQPKAATMPPVPAGLREWAFEYKQGWEDGVVDFARNPIARHHLNAEIRRDAWQEGWAARRRSLGLPDVYRHRIDVGVKARRSA